MKQQTNTTSISISKETKEKLLDTMHKYKFRNYDPFISSVLKILNKFKPELEELKQ